MCIKASRKLQTLALVAPCIDLSKGKFGKSGLSNLQFTYCSLVWVFHSRKLNNKINRLHGSRLKLDNDKQLTSKELLEKDDSISI